MNSALLVLGSSIVITPYTQTAQESGYGGQVETNGTAVTTTAIPFEEFKNLVKGKFGDLENAGFQLAIKHNVTLDISGDTKYKCTYQSEEYDLKEIKRYQIQETLVAYICTLTKRLD